MAKIEQPIKHRPNDDTYRVMVLDKQKNIDELTIACKLEGHEVVPIVSVAEGMRFLTTKDHIDVVISAVYLEDEDVFEFLKEIRQAPIHKDVKFMMICSDPSALANVLNKSVQTAAEVMGVDKYLMMTDYDIERLMKELKAILPAREPYKESDPSGAY